MAAAAGIARLAAIRLQLCKRVTEAVAGQAARQGAILVAAAALVWLALAVMLLVQRQGLLGPMAG